MHLEDIQLAISTIDIESEWSALALLAVVLRVRKPHLIDLSHGICSNENEGNNVLMPMPDPPRTSARIVTPRIHNRRRWVAGLLVGRENDRKDHQIPHS